MLKNLISITVVRYAVAIIGTFLFSKLAVPVELWDIVDDHIVEGIMTVIGGGSIIAALTAALTGIRESAKEKITINGERVTVPAPGENVTAREATTIKKAIASVEDRVTGKANK